MPDEYRSWPALPTGQLRLAWAVAALCLSCSTTAALLAVLGLALVPLMLVCVISAIPSLVALVFLIDHYGGPVYNTTDARRKMSIAGLGLVAVLLWQGFNLVKGQTKDHELLASVALALIFQMAAIGTLAWVMRKSPRWQGLAREAPSTRGRLLDMARAIRIVPELSRGRLCLAWLTMVLCFVCSGGSAALVIVRPGMPLVALCLGSGVLMLVACLRLREHYGCKTFEAARERFVVVLAAVFFLSLLVYGLLRRDEVPAKELQRFVKPVLAGDFMVLWTFIEIVRQRKGPER